MYILEKFSDFTRVEYLNRTHGDVAKKLADIDPTHNKKYLQWLIQKSETLPKDLSEVKSNLQIFSNIKSQNIYNFKSYSDLKKYIDSNNPIKVIIENENVRVIKPLSEQSAITYGTPKWCISSKKTNLFYKYSDFDVYIVEVKKDLGLQKYGDHMIDTKHDLDKVVDKDPESFRKIGIAITPKKQLEIWNANNYMLEFKYNYSFIKDLGLENFVSKLL